MLTKLEHYLLCAFNQMFIIYRTQYVSTVSTQEGINKMNVSKSITEHKIHFLLFEIMYSSREEKTNMHDPRFDPDWAISQDRDIANSFSAPFKSFHIILIFWRPWFPIMPSLNTLQSTHIFMCFQQIVRGGVLLRYMCTRGDIWYRFCWHTYSSTEIALVLLSLYIKKPKCLQELSLEPVSPYIAVRPRGISKG